MTKDGMEEPDHNLTRSHYAGSVREFGLYLKCNKKSLMCFKQGIK